MNNSTLKIILQILLLCLAANAGQEKNLGVKIGLARSSVEYNFTQSPNLSIDLFGDHQRRFGANIGIFMHLYRYKNLILISELQYQQRGDEKRTEIVTLQEPEGSGEFIVFDNLMEYLSLSSGLKYQLGYSLASPYVKACFSLNRLLRYRSFSLIGSDGFKNWVPGINLGVGLVFQQKYLVEIEYAIDLSKSYEGLLLATLDPFTVNFKHRLLSVSLGFMLP